MTHLEFNQSSIENPSTGNKARLAEICRPPVSFAAVMSFEQTPTAILPKSNFGLEFSIKPLDGQLTKLIRKRDMCASTIRSNFSHISVWDYCTISTVYSQHVTRHHQSSLAKVFIPRQSQKITINGRPANAGAIFLTFLGPIRPQNLPVTVTEPNSFISQASVTRHENRWPASGGAQTDEKILDDFDFQEMFQFDATYSDRIVAGWLYAYPCHPLWCIY
ncbi:hypothetical protein DFH06DRAFT_1120906 [Mycena polygramma]|nr:hypothetical protein DFH06DRAFT_1120906 [Mycena polygramma]